MHRRRASIVAACDIVIAADDAQFAIAEARWGLVSNIIIPQLNDAIGVRQVRRYALTGERFGAEEAYRIGLAHQVVAPDHLEEAGERIVDRLLQNGPRAIAESKATTLAHALGNLTPQAMAGLIELHAAKRRSDEASEGMASFHEKRAAAWYPG